MPQNYGFTVPEGDEENRPNIVIAKPDITIAPKPIRSKKSIENEAVTKENLAQQNKMNSPFSPLSFRTFAKSLKRSFYEI